MSLREAAQQALEALEDEPNAMVEWKPNHWEYKRVLALTAIRTALAEPEQDEIDLTTVYMAGRMDERKVQRKPLTDEEIELLAVKHAPPIDPAFAQHDDFIEFARAIERAHGIGDEA